MNNPLINPPVITCKRCGNCCKADFFAYITDEDLERWRREGRKDILHILENKRPFWAGDRIVSGASGSPLYSCPFFTWDGHLATCTIYDTRPKVCRDFLPGSNELCSQYRQRGEKGNTQVPTLTFGGPCSLFQRPRM